MNRPRMIALLAATAAGVAAVVGGYVAITQPTGPPIAILGDSYTNSEGAGSTRHGFPALLGNAVDVPVETFGQGGTGYVNPGQAEQRESAYLGRVAEVASSHPRLVIVQGSVNDTGPDVEQAAENTFQALHQQLPGVPVVAVGPAPTPARPAVDMAAVKMAAAAAGVEFIDTTGWLPVDDPTLWAADGVHPTASGHALIAAKLVSTLAAQLRRP